MEGTRLMVSCDADVAVVMSAVAMDSVAKSLHETGAEKVTRFTADIPMYRMRE